jgi:hypothetical protein
MEDSLNFKDTGRQHQFERRWKISFEIEDDISFLLGKDCLARYPILKGTGT